MLLATGCKPSDEAKRAKPRVFVNEVQSVSDVIEDLDAWLHGAQTGQDASSTTPQDPSRASIGEAQAAVDRMQASKHLDEALTLRGNSAKDVRIQAFERAIDADPTWAQPRFELAKTYAAGKKKKQAIKALEGLVSLASISGDNYLRRARVTSDFDGLHGDDAFRTATRFVPIEVSPARGTKNSKLVQELVKGLRARLIPARTGSTWKGKERATTVYYAKRNTIAEEAALEVVRSASLPPRVVSSKYLNAKRPVVLVLVESDTASAATFLTDKRLDDYMGLALHATGPEGAKHTFSLDKTGFFSWKTVDSGGVSSEKTGRYHVSSNRLSFSYRLIKRNAAGTIQNTEQGRRSSARLQLREGGLLLDTLEFKLSPAGSKQ